MRHNIGEGGVEINSISNDVKFSFLRIWDYPVKEQYASILMSIETAKPLPNASEGFRIVNERETSNFAFIHDAREIKYEVTRSEFHLSIGFQTLYLIRFCRNCNFSTVGDIFGEQPYALAVQQGSHLQVI